jgi:hypothetical protein
MTHREHNPKSEAPPPHPPSATPRPDLPTAPHMPTTHHNAVDTQHDPPRNNDHGCAESAPSRRVSGKGGPGLTAPRAASQCLGADGKCKNGFPWAYLEHTTWSARDSYPVYRRRPPQDDEWVHIHTDNHGNTRIITNADIVPHNQALCLKYDSHINVQVPPPPSPPPGRPPSRHKRTDNDDTIHPPTAFHAAGRHPSRPTTRAGGCIW